MTRQYVGARYVPKFFEGASGTDWTANTQYEPLTIVTRNGNSYTSKKYVPASVGAPEDNADYWASTGLYNSQVEQLRQDVEGYREDVEGYREEVSEYTEEVEDLKKKHLVIFGDSWADTEHTTYVKWPAYFDENIIKLEANYAQNGASLYGDDVPGTNGTVGGQVAVAAADSSYDKSLITDIIVIGGVNDFRGGRTPSMVAGAYDTLYNRIHALYPNARIVLLVDYQIYVTVDELAFCAFLVRTTKSNAHEAWHMLGWISPDNFIEDKIHPDNIGYKKIFTNVMSILCGGSPVRTETHASYSKTENGVSLTVEINEGFTDEGYYAFPAITLTGVTQNGTMTITDDTYKQSGCAFLQMFGNRYTNNINLLTRAICIQTYNSIDASRRGTSVKFELGYEQDGTFIGPVIERIAQ